MGSLKSLYTRNVCGFGTRGFLEWKRNRAHHSHELKVGRMFDKIMARKKTQDRFDHVSKPCLSDNLHTGRVSVKNAKISTRLRDKTIANMIKNELQNLIDCGELGNEIQSLSLTFTKATMLTSRTCQVFWEPFLSAKDLEIADALNRLSGKFRHLLSSNCMMNNVPTVKFYMDGDLYRIAMVDKIIKNGDLDVGDEYDMKDSVEVNSEEVPAPESLQLYRLDRENLFKKVLNFKENSIPRQY